MHVPGKITKDSPYWEMLDEIEQAEGQFIWLRDHSKEFSFLNIRAEVAEEAAKRLYLQVKNVGVELEELGNQVASMRAAMVEDSTRFADLEHRLASMQATLNAANARPAPETKSAALSPSKAQTPIARMPWDAICKIAEALDPNTPALLPGVTEAHLPNLRANLSRKLKAIGLDAGARITNDEHGVWVTLAE